MEEDRFQQNEKAFIIGMISLLLGLALLAFSLYILPRMVFGWHYDTPEFLMTWQEWLRSEYRLEAIAASRLVFAFFVILSIIFILIAYFTSNRIENQIYNEELQSEAPPPKVNRSTQDSIRFGLILLFIIIGVFIAAELFHWLIYSPTVEQAGLRQFV